MRRAIPLVFTIITLACLAGAQESTKLGNFKWVTVGPAPAAATVVPSTGTAYVANQVVPFEVTAISYNGKPLAILPLQGTPFYSGAYNYNSVTQEIAYPEFTPLRRGHQHVPSGFPGNYQEYVDEVARWRLEHNLPLDPPTVELLSTVTNTFRSVTVPGATAGRFASPNNATGDWYLLVDMKNPNGGGDEDIVRLAPDGSLSAPLRVIAQGSASNMYFDGTKLYVSGAASNSGLYIIDPVASFDTGTLVDTWVGGSFGSTGGLQTMLSAANGDVYVLSNATIPSTGVNVFRDDQLLAFVPIPGAEQLAQDLDNGAFYVTAEYFGGFIWRIDGTLLNQSPISVPDGPTYIAYNAWNKSMYFLTATSRDATINQLQPRAGNAVTSIAVLQTGSYPEGLTINPYTRSKGTLMVAVSRALGDYLGLFTSFY